MLVGQVDLDIVATNEGLLRHIWFIENYRFLEVPRNDGRANQSGAMNREPVLTSCMPIFLLFACALNFEIRPS